MKEYEFENISTVSIISWENGREVIDEHTGVTKVIAEDIITEKVPGTIIVKNIKIIKKNSGQTIKGKYACKKTISVKNSEETAHLSCVKLND